MFFFFWNKCCEVVFLDGNGNGPEAFEVGEIIFEQLYQYIIGLFRQLVFLGCWKSCHKNDVNIITLEVNGFNLFMICFYDCFSAV